MMIEEAMQIQRQAETALLAIPGVTGIDADVVETSAGTSTAAIRVFVSCTTTGNSPAIPLEIRECPVVVFHRNARIR